MAKRNKQRPRKRLPQMSPKKLNDKVAAVMRSFRDGDVTDSRSRLERLLAQNPRSEPVLSALVEVCQEMRDWRSMTIYNERLLPLERGKNRAIALNNMVYALIQLPYPALAMHYAETLLERYPDFEHIDSARSLVETARPMLLDEAEGMLPVAEFTPSEKLELMVLHDRVRFYTESGQGESAIRAAETFLEKAPDTIAVLNNLSLARFMTGDIDRAITTAERVLALAPDNFNALGNLVRYTFLTGRFEEAEQYAESLKRLEIDHFDGELKRAEALAFPGDDEGIRAAYRRARERQDEIDPLLLHLAATAHYRLGDEKTAWQLWRDAVTRNPGLDLAQRNLDDGSLPAGERDAPWYWSLSYWLPGDLRRVLNGSLDKKKHNKARVIEQQVRSLLEKRPYLPRLFPHMLERGDRVTRELVLHLIRMVATPEMLKALHDFACGPYGADDLRLEALQFIARNHPSLLPENRQVSMWREGQQTELLLVGFEITDEPDRDENVSEQIREKYQNAYELLQDDKLDAAETLLQEIIAKAPNFPKPYNQLAVVYERKGQQQEARQLIEQAHARSPDYLFARVGLARMYCREGKIEEARALLTPLLRRQRLHISEFRALAAAQIDLCLADGQRESARYWLEMWRQIDPDDPQLMELMMRVVGPEGLKERLMKLLDSGRAKKR